MTSIDFDRGYDVGLATRESVFQLRAQRDRLTAQNPDLLATLREIADICRGPAATLNELAHAVEESALGAIARVTEGTPLCTV